MVDHTYPKHDTQAARLLAVLLSGRSIGPLVGWRQLGIYRLSDTVYQLNKAGWQVQTERVARNNRFGEPCRFAAYNLLAEVIDAAGLVGQAFASNEMDLIEAKARRVAA